jgi:hypothetical protein
MKRSAMILMLAVLPNLQAAPTKFGAAIVDAGNRIENARQQFLKLLAPFQEDQSGDVAALEGSYAIYVQAIADGTETARTVTTPSSAECIELRRAFLILLASEDEATKDLASVVEKIRAAHGRLDLLGKLNVSGSLNRCAHSETAALRDTWPPRGK